MNIIKKYRLISFAVILTCMLFVCACTSAKKKQEMRKNAITLLYNDYIDGISTLSTAEIVSKCDQAIKDFPYLAIAYELKGMIYREEGELKPAWENYKKAVELSPYDEDTLASAREVALQLNGSFIRINEDTSIQLIPFKKVSLEEYTQGTDEWRFKLCTIALGLGKAATKKTIRESNNTTAVFVDQSGNEIKDMEKMTFGLSFEGNPSAAELDNWLIQKADTEPDSPLGKVLWRFMARKMNYGRVN